MSAAVLDNPVHAASAQEVLDAIRKARESRQPLRIAGAGSWLSAGAPVRDASLLSVAPLTGIVEYVPGDFTLTARAGTTLEQIASVTRAEGQWLALDPPGGAQGTLGATISTASAGALASGYGTPRDQVLGLEAITGKALRVSAGGRVVKNVAGFDLTRLFTGSWGTLGVITQVSVRLRALPETDRTTALMVPKGRRGLGDLLEALRNAKLDLSAAELLNGKAAAACAIDGDSGSVLLVRLTGNEAVTTSQMLALSALADARDMDARVWDRLRRIEAEHAAVYRLSRAPAFLADLYEETLAMLSDESGALVHATVERGVVRVILPLDVQLPPAQAARALRRFDATIVTERAPEQDRIVRHPHAAGDTAGARRALAERVREAFDPDCILNPGILAEDPE